MAYKTTVFERITLALQRSDKSQRDLARHMGLSASAVNRMLSKDVDSVKYIQAVEALTGYRFEWLRTGSGTEKTADDSDIDVQSLDFLKRILKTKDDLIREQSGRIEDLQKYVTLLESQLEDLKKRVEGLQKYIAAPAFQSKDHKKKTDLFVSKPASMAKKPTSKKKQVVSLKRRKR